MCGVYLNYLVVWWRSIIHQRQQEEPHLLGFVWIAGFSIESQESTTKWNVHFAKKKGNVHRGICSWNVFQRFEFETPSVILLSLWSPFYYSDLLIFKKKLLFKHKKTLLFRIFHI